MCACDLLDVGTLHGCHSHQHRREADYFLPYSLPERIGGGPPISTLILSNLLGWTGNFIEVALVLQDPAYPLFLVDYLRGAIGALSVRAQVPLQR